MKSLVFKRSIVVAGHKTSVSLEDAFWNGLKDIARERHMNLSEVVAEIDAQRQPGNLSSALRLFVLDFYRTQLSHNNEGRDETHEMIGQDLPPLRDQTATTSRIHDLELQDRPHSILRLSNASTGGSSADANARGSRAG